MARTLLSAAVLLVSALGLSGAFVRFRPCSTCDGLALAAKPPMVVGCPDCGDTGKMSLFRSLHPRVAPSVAEVVRAFKDTRGSSGVRAIEQLARKNGTEPAWFTLGMCGKYPKARPRFVESDGKRYLVLVVTDPGDYSAQPYVTVLLLSLRGQFHDRVDLSCGGVSPPLLEAKVLDAPASDGTRITVSPETGSYTLYRVYQGQQVVREAEVYQTPESGDNLLCRMGIRADRLEVLFPVK